MTPKSANFTPASADKRRLPACEIEDYVTKNDVNCHGNDENFYQENLNIQKYYRKKKFKL